ncbi:MAG: hypothetical protein RMM58_00965 [Chloroflexota bacterium]|nr:hypothetical protein [Dehalococcoidia bacterium]MDW8252429.1 hypothetical protein [Chloroflexota bacterium]
MLAVRPRSNRIRTAAASLTPREVGPGRCEILGGELAVGDRCRWDNGGQLSLQGEHPARSGRRTGG